MSFIAIAVGVVVLIGLAAAVLFLFRKD